MIEGRQIPTEFFTPRHTKKTKTPTEGSESSGEFYPGISPEGEETVREKTRNEVMEIIEQSAPGSVVVFGGASDYPRTKSSTRVSGSELKNLLSDRKDEFLVLDENDINSLVSDPSKESTLKAVKDIVASNPDKKAVLIYPMYIEELSMDEKSVGRNAGKPRWKSGGATAETFSPFVTEILKRNNNDEYAAVSEWVESNGVLKTEDGTEVHGPKAEETAEAYITALQRLESVAKKLFPNRPLVIEATGHSWDIDVFITYLAKGKLDKEGLDEIARGTGDTNSIISDFEFPVIKLDKDKSEVTYRGKTYPIQDQLLK